MTDPGLKSGISVRELISTQKTKNKKTKTKKTTKTTTTTTTKTQARSKPSCFVETEFCLRLVFANVCRSQIKFCGRCNADFTVS